jgi:hypothetical protein
VLFDIGRHRDRLNILQAAEAGALAPIQELADGMIVSDPRVLVADGNGEKFEVSLGRFKISGLQKVPFSNMIKLIIAFRKGIKDEGGHPDISRA